MRNEREPVAAMFEDKGACSVTHPAKCSLTL